MRTDGCPASCALLAVAGRSAVADRVGLLFALILDRSRLVFARCLDVRGGIFAVLLDRFAQVRGGRLEILGGIAVIGFDVFSGLLGRALVACSKRHHTERDCQKSGRFHFKSPVLLCSVPAAAADSAIRSEDGLCSASPTIRSAGRVRALSLEPRGLHSSNRRIVASSTRGRRTARMLTTDLLSREKISEQ